MFSNVHSHLHALGESHTPLAATCLVSNLCPSAPCTADLGQCQPLQTSMHLYTQLFTRLTQMFMTARGQNAMTAVEPHVSACVASSTEYALNIPWTPTPKRTSKTRPCMASSHLMTLLWVNALPLIGSTSVPFLTET